MKRMMAVAGVMVMAAYGAALGQVGGEVPKARADFLKLIERPRVAANFRAQAGVEKGGVVETAFSFDAEAGQTVPGIMVKKVGATGRLPVVIALHGTGGTKEGMLALLRELAGKGFLGVAIDGRYHGARATEAKKEAGMNAYESAILRAWRGETPQEHPFFFDTAWDVMRLIDVLEKREDVDAGRIGIYGVSKGGIEAYLAAAADVRIAAAVPCISVESFAWAVDNNSWQSRIGTVQKVFDLAAKEAGVAGDAAMVKKFYARVAPGIDGEFDGPSLIPLVAPRALMAINGALDPRTPAGGLKLTTEAIGAAYQKARAAEKFEVLIQPNTAHQVKPEAQAAGVAFLVKWLKPGDGK